MTVSRGLDNRVHAGCNGVKCSRNRANRGVWAALLERLERLDRGLRQDGIEETVSGFCCRDRRCGLGQLHVRRGCFVDLHLCRLNDSSLQTQLELGFRCPVQLFVDAGIVTIQCNVCPGRIGKAVKLDLVVFRNGKQETKL